VEDAAIAAELAPCFVDRDGRRTDTVALACTHFPLLLPWLDRLAPWPVAWIDPAPAIARRVIDLIGKPAGDRAPPGRAIFTSGRAPPPALANALSRFGLAADLSVGAV
jgi:glutamate racemase